MLGFNTWKYSYFSNKVRLEMDFRNIYPGLNNKEITR